MLVFYCQNDMFSYLGIHKIHYDSHCFLSVIVKEVEGHLDLEFCLALVFTAADIIA